MLRLDGFVIQHAFKMLKEGKCPVCWSNPCTCYKKKKDEEKPFEVNVENLNKMLAAATDNCFYKINGFCDTECPARDYCNPAGLGLKEL